MIGLATCMMGLRGKVLVQDKDNTCMLGLRGERAICKDKVSTLYAEGRRVLGHDIKKVSTLYAGVKWVFAWVSTL